MKLPIAYYGEPVLRKKAARVEQINEEIKQLVFDMIETMKDLNGLGLAAPQVHKSLAIFIIDVPLPGPDDTWIPGEVRVFINPKVYDHSKETWVMSEGCLSIPKIYEDVVRPTTVTVEAMDLDGKTFVETFTELQARAILHENDHINGILFIDRIHGEKRKKLEPMLRAIKQKYYLNK